ncbi:MAG TPA: response regulator [Gemmatimonadales bacterium]
MTNATTDSTTTASRGRILLADDEPTFVEATAELLRLENYECDTVSDGRTALERIAQATYHLLISDLMMPGNDDLSLIRQLAERAGGLPVIILTAYPSTRTAIASIELPVTAYMVKPVSFGDLLGKVDVAVSRFRAFSAMREAEQRLRECGQALHSISETSVATGPSGETVDAFLALTLRNVMGSLNDLEHLGRALTRQTRVEGPHPCQLINCPRGLQLRDAIQETVRVLEETKGSFRSKTLGTLRRQLELLLEYN